MALSASDIEAVVIRESGIPTSLLLALALTAPVRDHRNELFGRSHAWYSIAASQASAIAFAVEAEPGYQREMAAQALARAGYQLGDLSARPVAEPMPEAAQAAVRQVERPYITITAGDVGATQIETNLGPLVLAPWVWPVDEGLVGRRVYGTAQADGTYQWMLEDGKAFEERQQMPAQQAEGVRSVLAAVAGTVFRSAAPGVALVLLRDDPYVVSVDEVGDTASAYLVTVPPADIAAAIDADEGEVGGWSTGWTC